MACLDAWLPPEDRVLPLVPSVPKAYPANTLSLSWIVGGRGTLAAEETILLIEHFQANIFINRTIPKDCSETLQQAEVGRSQKPGLAERSSVS